MICNIRTVSWARSFSSIFALGVGKKREHSSRSFQQPASEKLSETGTIWSVFDSTVFLHLLLMAIIFACRIPTPYMHKSHININFMHCIFPLFGIQTPSTTCVSTASSLDLAATIRTILTSTITTCGMTLSVLSFGSVPQASQRPAVLEVAVSTSPSASFFCSLHPSQPPVYPRPVSSVPVWAVF